MKYVMTPQTEKTEDADGLLTKRGMAVAHEYAVGWVTRSIRNLNLEREHPELLGLFYDIRADPGYASQHAVVANANIPRPTPVIPLA